MSKAIIRVDQNGTTARLKFVDGKGNPAQPASPPKWSVTVDGVITMTVADDGMSAAIAPAGVGDTTINVTAEGDPTPGVDTVLLSGDVSVVPAEIATGTLDFDPVA